MHVPHAVGEIGTVSVCRVYYYLKAALHNVFFFFFFPSYTSSSSSFSAAHLLCSCCILPHSPRSTESHLHTYIYIHTYIHTVLYMHTTYMHTIIGNMAIVYNHKNIKQIWKCGWSGWFCSRVAFAGWTVTVDQILQSHTPSIHPSIHLLVVMCVSESQPGHIYIYIYIYLTHC